MPAMSSREISCRAAHVAAVCQNPGKEPTLGRHAAMRYCTNRRTCSIARKSRSGPAAHTSCCERESRLALLPPHAVGSAVVGHTPLCSCATCTTRVGSARKCFTNLQLQVRESDALTARKPQSAAHSPQTQGAGRPTACCAQRKRASAQPAGPGWVCAAVRMPCCWTPAAALPPQLSGRCRAGHAAQQRAGWFGPQTRQRSQPAQTALPPAPPSWPPAAHRVV